MNRAVRKLHQRRCALKNVRGGGFEVVSPSDPTAFGYLPEYKQTADCYDQARPGALATQVDTGLAQAGPAILSSNYGAAMAGGSRGCGCPFAQRSGSQRSGSQRGGSRRGCGCMRGGRKTRRRRHQLGGRFAVDPSMSVGGDGPIAAPVNTAVPCDIRAGSPNPFAPNMLTADPRAPAGLYSATPNQSAPISQSGGGALVSSEYPSVGYMEARIPNFDYHQTGAGLRSGRTRRLRLRGGAGNAYDASCYRAPGSEIPVYPAESAGFRFAPSTAAGATLPDGVTAYNEVVPYAARMAGGRRRTRTRNARRRRTTRTRNARGGSYDQMLNYRYFLREITNLWERYNLAIRDHSDDEAKQAVTRIVEKILDTTDILVQGIAKDGNRMGDKMIQVITHSIENNNLVIQDPEFVQRARSAITRLRRLRNIPMIAADFDF